MYKDIWQEVRESILDNLIANFSEDHGRLPSIEEEFELEMTITEDQMREALRGFDLYER